MIKMEDIKIIREELRVSQPVICRAAGISQAHLSSMERGLTKTPGKDILMKIEKKFEEIRNERGIK